jgi:hypothetical protein
MLGIAPIAHCLCTIVIDVYKHSFFKCNYFVVHLQIGQITPNHTMHYIEWPTFDIMNYTFLVYIIYSIFHLHVTLKYT